MADFPTLKTTITIKQAADMLGLKLKADGANFRAACPICHEGGDRAFKLFTATNTFWCYTHKKSGTIIDLVANVLKCDAAAAGRKLAEHFEVKSPPRKPETGNGKPFDPVEWGRGLDPSHEALAPLELSPDTLRALGAGFNPARPSLKGLLCVPVQDAAGTPGAFVGINPADPGDVHYPNTFDRNRWRFVNASQVRPGTLHVVAHPLDVLRQIDTGNPELTNVLGVLPPLALPLLKEVLQLAEARGVEGFEFH